MGTATTYLLKHGYTKIENKEYFKYYDVLILEINGQTYEGIVLDSCGACMKKNLIDLFVSSPNSVITTNIKIR